MPAITERGLRKEEKPSIKGTFPTESSLDKGHQIALSLSRQETMNAS